MCLCKKINKYYLGNNPNHGKAVKLTSKMYQTPVTAPIKKAGYSSKKYINGKVQLN